MAFIECLDFDAERLAASMNQGNIDATLQMEQRVNEGMPLREAHHATANALHNGGSNPMPPQLPDLTRYQTIGSANPSETRRVAAALVASLEAGT